jgi:4-aminobutyrate aminotransferase-like enzyme
VHQSTFGRNQLSMAAGLAVLRIIERDGLVDHAARVGQRLLAGLKELQERYEIIADARGLGLMVGFELQPPSSRFARFSWHLMQMASEGLFPQLIVIPLHRDHRVITMAAGKNDVIKLLPPLTVSDNEVDVFLGALDAVLADCETDASKNWGVVRGIALSAMSRKRRAKRR